MKNSNLNNRFIKTIVLSLILTIGLGFFHSINAQTSTPITESTQNHDSTKTIVFYISVIVSSLIVNGLLLILVNKKIAVTQNLDPKLFEQQRRQLHQLTESLQKSQSSLYYLNQRVQALENKLDSINPDQRVQQYEPSQTIAVLDDSDLEFNFDRDLTEEEVIIQEYNNRINSPSTQVERVTAISPGSRELKPDQTGKYEVKKRGDNLFLVPGSSFHINSQNSTYISQYFALLNYDENSPQKQKFKLNKPAKVISKPEGLYEIKEKGILEFEVANIAN